MMKFRFRRQGTDPQREKIKQELFAFNKTVEHGFPHQPSALAFDPKLQLMAIGTKSGAIKIYGAPGVEFTGLHKDTTAVTQIHFLPGQGRLLSLLDDNTIHLWELVVGLHREVGGAKKEGGVCLKQVDNYTLPGRPGIESCSATHVTVLLLLKSCDLLCVGTEGGGVYFVELPRLELRESQTLLQDQVTQSLPDEYRCGKSLGPVESLQEHPQQPGKILIGYSRGLVVLWDLGTRHADQLFLGKQQLESLVWERSGSLFVSSHNDGGYAVWPITSGNSCTHQPASSTIPYGPFPCKAINKILWRTSQTG
uniref:LLGL scribble cell polarity complex component 1 n=2 Tax=Poecilia reticulata TaxID=8081 RepID=A0A3P9Q666_POERE